MYHARSSTRVESTAPGTSRELKSTRRTSRGTYNTTELGNLSGEGRDLTSTCSAGKGNHAGYRSSDNEQMKRFLDQLPDGLTQHIR